MCKSPSSFFISICGATDLSECHSVFQQNLLNCEFMFCALIKQFCIVFLENVKCLKFRSTEHTLCSLFF